MTDIVRELFDAKADLDRAKARHDAAQAAVAAAFFTAPTEGTNTFELGQGWQLKGTFKVNRKVDHSNGKLLAVCAFLPTDVPAQLFKPTYRLALTKYRELEPGQRQEVDKIVTATPATPTIKIAAPGDNTE